MKTICWLAIEMISRIEAIHSNNMLHRDIKPENFLIKEGRKATSLYVIDLGLSKRYKDPKTGKHNLMNKRNGITGTPRWCSKMAHQCYE